MKRIVAILLCLCIAVAWLPMGIAAAETDLVATIEEQIRAYADSIDRTDAVDDAALALAAHGMFQGGKKLSVGKSHALTATLFNSELLQAALIDGCTEAIRAMQLLDRAQLSNIFTQCNWSGDGDYYYGDICAFTSDELVFDNWDMILHSGKGYSTSRNGYDDSLRWIAGGASVLLQIERTKRTADSAVYQVTCKVFDRFDFSTSSSSFFKALISGIGAILFREFDWESEVTFKLTVPYTCDHSSGAYRWTYDAECSTFTSDSSGGWQRNDTTRHTYVDATGSESYGHELEQTVRLRHDKPWVMEYDISRPGSFALSPLEIPSETHPELRHFYGQSLYVTRVDRVKLSDEEAADYGLKNPHLEAYHYYGARFYDWFAWDNEKIYTLRLENEVGAGENMIYLTVLDAETGVVCMDHVPLDDYYIFESWKPPITWKSDSSGWISGKNIYINFIGNKWSRFSARHFELRIWENGENGESYSYYEKTGVTAPTCTAKGYTTYTCSACGHSKKADYVAAGHSWGDWETISETQRQRTCTVCGETEREEISVLYGDANGDGEISGKDLILLRQYLADWNVTLDLNATDANGDGEINGKDLILLRQYLAGWDVTLGPKTP